MKILIQIALIAGFCILGDWISSLLPIPFPGSVIAMILLFLALLIKIIKEKQIELIGDFLLKNMAFFFIPAGVSVMNYFDILKQSFFPFLIICAITLVLTFAVTAFTVSMIMNIVEKREEYKRKTGRTGETGK